MDEEVMLRLVVEGAEEAIAETLGNLRANLETLKKTRKLSNNDLGMFAHVGEKTVWAWFKQGRTPDIENLAPIARALGLQFWELFLPPADFTELYGGDDENFQVTVVSSPRSSSRSKAKRRAGSRRAVASAPKRKEVTKDSPFCKPAFAAAA